MSNAKNQKHDMKKALKKVLTDLGITDTLLVGEDGRLVNPQRRLLNSVLSKSFGEQKLSLLALQEDLAARKASREADNALLENS